MIMRKILKMLNYIKEIYIQRETTQDSMLILFSIHDTLYIMTHMGL
jgi:hypothetical protein